MKVRRKPGEVIEARQWKGLASPKDLVGSDWPVGRDPQGYFTTNSAGQKIYLDAGDWLMPDGDRFTVLKPVEFEAAYERFGIKDENETIIKKLVDAILQGEDVEEFEVDEGGIHAIGK